MDLMTMNDYLHVSTTKTFTLDMSSYNTVSKQL
jgi:hypothetical protein